MHAPTYNSVLAHLEKKDADEVVRMGRAVSELRDSDGWQIVSQMLSRADADMQTTLLQGVHEHAEFASMTGYLKGVRSAEAVVEAVVEAANRADRRLAQIAQEHA